MIKTGHHHIFSIFLPLIVFVALLSSCGSSRQGAGNQGKVSQGETSTLAHAYTSLTDSYSNDWTTLSVPVNVSLKSPKRISASGTMTMTRGKDISISMRVLGIEVASIYITGDSVIALDKWHKYYLAESVESLLGGMPATVGNLQDMILGHIFLLGENPVTAKDVKKFTLTPGTGDWFAAPRNTPGNIDYQFAVMNDDNRLALLTATIGSRGPVVCTYGDYSDSTPAGTAANSLTVKVSGSKTAVEAALSLKMSKAKWNSAPARPVTIPRGYTRIEKSSLLKLIPSL